MVSLRDPTPLRVILVGPTGLDALLRRDGAMELVHVPDGVEAVAEVAEAVSADPTAPAPVVVLGAGVCAASGGELGKTLKGIDPRVRVVGVSDGGAAGCDAVVEPGADAASLREALSPGGRGPAVEAAAVVGAARVTPGACEAPCEVGDAAVVRSLLMGRDISGPLIEQVRARLGDPAAQLVWGAEGPGLEVRPGGVAAARLVTGADPARAAEQCEWLASWIRLRDQHEQLKEAAFTDPLTGAHNRRYFDLFLASAIERARRDRQPVTLMLFDIDNFKAFNDHQGHEAGDRVLRETVRLLRSVIRPADKVCRIGGDEFVVIFHEPEGPRQPGSKPPSSVFQIARRFQEQVARQRFPTLGSQLPGSPQRLAVSGGLATFPWDGATPEALLRRADELLLESKRRGKNAILFGPEAGRGSGVGEA